MRTTGLSSCVLYSLLCWLPSSCESSIGIPIEFAIWLWRARTELDWEFASLYSVAAGPFGPDGSFSERHPSCSHLAIIFFVLITSSTLHWKKQEVTRTKTWSGRSTKVKVGRKQCPRPLPTSRGRGSRMVHQSPSCISTTLGKTRSRARSSAPRCRTGSTRTSGTSGRKWGWWGSPRGRPRRLLWRLWPWLLFLTATLVSVTPGDLLSVHNQFKHGFQF